MKHSGSCHCGKIAFDVEGEIENVMRCNCSICSKRGYLLWPVSQAKFTLNTPITELAYYTFNKHVIKHFFCTHCGCAPFGEGINPKTSEAMTVINANCLDTLAREALSALPTVDYDGRSL